VTFTRWEDLDHKMSVERRAEIKRKALAEYQPQPQNLENVPLQENNSQGQSITSE
jgi:hypothetical protein